MRKQIINFLIKERSLYESENILRVNGTRDTGIVSTQKLIDNIEKFTVEMSINFALWLRDNDIAENADKYFGYSDKDMLNEFLKSRDKN